MSLLAARRQAAEQPGWLQQLPADLRDEVLSRCTLHHYKAGEALHIEGDAATSMYGIVGGQTKVYMPGSDGQAHLVHIMLPGAWAGEGPAMVGLARPISLIAARPTATLRLSHQDMAQIIAAEPDRHRPFVRHLMSLLNLALLAMADSMIRDRTIRVASILIRLANLPPYHPDDPRWTATSPIEIAVSQDELAGMANLGRTVTSAVLSDLQDRELIERRYGAIAVLHPRGLMRLLQR